MIAATCEANDINIHYLRTGGPKPPLILLHGLMGSGATWRPVARALEADYDVLMPDARGHGQSSAPPQGYRYEDLAADVVGLIGALGLKAPVLMGHSMGGMTAAVIAAHMATALRGVILADPTFLSPEMQREVFESDVAGQQRVLLNAGREEALAQARLRQPHRAPDLLDSIIDARLQTHVRAFDILRPPNPDYREVVKAISVPVLLVAGDKGVVSAEKARELQTLNPRLRYECIPHAGHGLPFDQPEALASVAAEFVMAAVRGN